MKDRNISTDFWWLSPEELRQYRYVDLFHQEPYSDEPNTDKDPRSCPMLRNDKRCLLDSVGEWKEKFRNINVFRSFALYNADIEGEEITGPLLLDIDRTLDHDGGYLPDFDKAIKDTRILVREYCSALEKTSYRVFSLGIKGSILKSDPM